LRHPEQSAGPLADATRLHDWAALFRPRQWVKNSFVLAPLVFSGRAAEVGAVGTALLSAALFSGLASGIYAINDALDRESDRAHPLKRNRPVASGRISYRQAMLVGGVLAALATVGAFLVEPAFGFVALTYLGLNVAYSTWLKSVVILDVFTVSSFFLLRLLAGAFVISVVPSVWLLLCGGLLALHLGFTKRRHELSILGDASPHHRAVLTQYSAEFLDQMSSVLLSVTVVSYIMYSLTSETAQTLGTDALSYSVAFVLYGVFRYLYLVHRRGGGCPTETLLADGHLLSVVALWLAYCGWVIYGAR
jgi:4-hydroxybenzoate polyprenyltransferase